MQRSGKKKTPGKLGEKNEELDQFFNVSLDFLCIANTDGYFVRLSPSFEKVLGYTTEELMAQPFLEFVHPEDRDATREAMVALGQQKKMFDFTNRYRCKDGAYRWLEWRSVVSGNMVYGAARDITERKIAEESLKERLAFEGLLSDISASMTKAALDRIDQEIAGGLARLLELFRVDRCCLLQISPDHTSWRITHLAVAEGLSPLPVNTDLPLDLIPYGYRKVVEEQKVWAFASLDDLPPEADADRLTLEKWGIRSAISIPIGIGGSVEYTIAVTANREMHTWSQDHIPRLRMMGEVFVNVLQRRRIRAELEERLQFERLLSELSARFVNIPPEQVDREIDEALRMICEHCGFEVATLWQRSDSEPDMVTLTHLYRPLGGPPLPEHVDARDTWPWCLRELMSGRVVAVSTEEAPADAALDQEMWRYYGIESSLTFPLSAGGGQLIGALGFNTVGERRSWSHELVKRLQLLAQVFANALARKQSEHALRESEERLSLASASAGVGVWILDSATGQFWITTKGLELLGLATDSALNLDNFLELVHPEDRGRVLETVNQALRSDDDISIEYRVILPDKSTRWILSRGRREPGSPEQAERLMGVSADISERKQAEAAVAEAQSMITALVESTDDMVWSVDPERFGLLTFNSALRNYFLRGMGLEITLGMSPKEMVGGPFTPLVAEKWCQLYLRALREGPFTEEYATSAGTNVLLLSFNLLKRSGQVFGISVFGKDITERKAMDEKIRKAAREWQGTFDAIPDLVMILDKQCRIVRINATARSYFGLPVNEVIGADCSVLMHKKENPVFLQPFLKTMESREHEESESYDEARNSWFRISADPIVDDNGDVRQIIYSLKDITEQKRGESEAFAARKELWRTDRLLRMGELTASLAHELNQPLTSILSNAKAAIRFIRSDRLDMNEMVEILEDIAKDDKRAGDIIRSLRSMLRPEEGEQEIIDINNLLGETVALFNSEAIIRNIRIETKFAGSLPLVEANKIQLQQVVINLLMNAAESMMDEHRSKEIILETRTINENRVQVAVRDFGTGIGENELSRIFEPFFTTKRSGLGMGLSLARSIIEAQAGHIRAENNPDGGATFYFELPGVKK
ncbi:MAG: Sensor protein FixL [Syntrophorhabdus sp. PtaU1.Bin153]|nr:MAG: Sensor protein FixL [Syntrophorhabdus sp. PtaU1.Bin153]